MSRSDELFEQAKKVIPGGVNSPVRAFRAVGRNPLFIQKGYRDFIQDVDGKEYLDYVMSWGPLVLGHARQEVLEAVTKAVQNGLTFGAPTQRETELAEEICRAGEYLEQVRLVNSGTEATMSAIRLVRGYTGRDKIIKFAGNYHGHSDGLLVKAGSGCLTGAFPDSLGVPASYAEQTLVAEYNNIQSVQALFDANDREIACVILEPVAANMGVVPPKEGFLSQLRQLCSRHGALLIFDEVITGFRVAYGGAAQRYGVSPDLACFGKIVGGGMPLAAYGGRKEILSMVAPLGGVYQAGTLSGNPVATAAGLATLRILREQQDTIYPALEEKGAMLEQAFQQAGLPVNRVGSLLSAFFRKGAPGNYQQVCQCNLEAFSVYFNRMLEQGIYVAPSQFEAMFVSIAHTQEHLQRTCQCIVQIGQQVKDQFAL